MPTLFERLDVALEGNGLTTALSGQVAQLTTLTETVAGLIQDPPDSLADFSRVIEELPFPDLLGDGFASSLNGLQRVLPTELSSVVGDLTTGLANLQNTVAGDVTAVLDQVLTVIRAIYRLSQIDLSCMAQGDGGAASAAGDSGGGGAPAGGGGAVAPDQPSGLAQANQQVDAVNGALDHLPSPLNVANLLRWLNDLTAFRHKANILSRTLPLIDDVIDPLNTLVAWHAGSAEAIRDQVALSIQELSAFVQATVPHLAGALASDITAAAAGLQTDALRDTADGLTSRLQQLQAAVTAADLSATPAVVSEINALLDGYDTLRDTLQSGVLATLPSLNTRLDSFGDAITDAMGHLLSTLRPNPAVGDLANALPAATPVFGKIEEQFRPLTAWMQTLTDQLDLQAIQAPLTTVAQTARTAVDGLEQGLVQVTIQVRAIFGELESLLDSIDTTALVGQVQDAIDAFASQVTTQIEDLFAPAREAVSRVIDTIGQQIDGFSPDQIIDPLREAIGGLAGVFQDPSVVSTMNDIRGLLDQVKTRIEQLSFAPLTDQVVAGLDEIAEALQGIDASNLNAMLMAALDAALAVLPDDLQPLTDPLIDEFDGLIEAGPVPLLEMVKAQPDRLMARVRAFEPADLVGSALSAPFDQLVQTMRNFKPSTLLAPIHHALDKLKQQLTERSNPGQLLDLFKPAFDTLLAGFDRLDPQDLVAPLSQAVNDTINHVLDVLPVDEVLAQIDKALAAVQDVVGFGDGVVGTLERIGRMMGDLADSETQLTAWLNVILDKIAAVADLSPIEARFSELSAALDATRSAALSGVLQAAVTPVVTILEDLAPLTRHGALVQAYSGIPATALAALPDSAEKTAVAAVLNRFDPMAPAFGQPYQRIGQFQRALSQTLAGLPTLFSAWDARFHSAESTLSAYRVDNVTGSQLRAWVQTEIDHSFFHPLKQLLAQVEALTAPVSAVYSQMTQVIATLRERVNALLTGPDAVGGIRDALGDLIQRLRDFNLDFLTSSLNELFNELREKLQGVNPAQFKATLDDSFQTMLNTIDLDLIIPADALQTLDEDFEKVIDKFELLNPVKLVTEIIQPEYEETVPPLIEAFDVSMLLTAIIDRLRSLDEELKEEMERVNAAFRGMKQSVPTGGGMAEVSI